MTGSNETVVSEFILLGFSNLGQLQILLFGVFLVVYLATLTGNTLIIILTKTDPALHSPMYFFLRNLSFAEVGFVSSTVPKMLVNLLSEKKTISLLGCRAQTYFVFFFGTMECFLLIAMAYDRFVAICKPLRYPAVMNKKICRLMALAACASGFPVGTVQSSWLFSFPFCRTNVIPHFFCDTPPLLELVCGDTSKFELFSLIGTFIIILAPFTLILISYIRIISTILRMPSTEGKQKAFSTCSSHIMAVTLFYGTSSLTYFRPRSNYTPEIKQLLSLSYTILVPMLNPIIYSLRNKEMKGAFTRLLRRKMS
ncbi:PREDICTED: olfactory receptor 10A5-like [Gekko japonicus]|uniref:Olfactory receptor n=1 Tax=Gekko japonicus TaxID=146911 RepID=A0ABM1K9D2_GEKJA|nr:PREDICTED: olfactory receptor 10A5-like [Gekko japonicus]